MTENKVLTVEYLISINSKNVFNSCSTKESFNNLLCSNSNIKIKENKINYKETLDIEYILQLTEKDKINFYHMIFKCNRVDKLELYEEFLRFVKSVFCKVSDNGIISLWDDISVHYCKESYPLINEVENLMRKLLTKFMMINVGEEWDKLDISTEIKQSISKKKKNIGKYDYLYETDFIKLAEFLFKEYPNVTYENFNKTVKNLDNPEEFDINDLIKKSNWDRYFKDIVDCDGEFINKRWKKLYELRCKVAHNNTLEIHEYKDIVKLVKDVKPKLESAIEKLDEVRIDENSKPTIVENIIDNIHPEAMIFLEVYNDLTRLLLDISKYFKLNSLLFAEIVRGLYSVNFIGKELFDDLIQSHEFRNRLVHDMNGTYAEKEIPEAILVLVRSFDILNDEYKKHINES